jgi:hypothetical protein
VRKWLEDGRSLAELELWAKDQRGRITTTGSARVRLPSRAEG